MAVQQAVPILYKSVSQIGLRSASVTSFIGNTAGFTLIGGTSTTADLTFQTTSGVGATGADMHFLVGNNGATEAMTILNSGNVGIGTTSPSANLDIIGQIEINNPTVSVGAGAYNEIKGLTVLGANTDGSVWPVLVDLSGIRIKGSGTIGFTGNSNYSNQGLDTSLYRSSAGVFRTASSFIIDGNVGIGTTSPGAKLMVDGSADDEQLIVQAFSTQTANIVEIQNSSAAVLVSFSGLGGAVFNEQGGDTDFRIEGDNEIDLFHVDASVDRIGINIAAPTAKFDILTDSSPSSTIGLRVTIDSNIATETGLIVKDFTNFAHSGIMAHFQLVNATDSGQVLRLDNAGTGLTLNITDGTNTQVSISKVGAVVINEGGGADADLRVEGDTDANLLFTDASADTVQVGAATASDSAKFYVSGKISASGEVEINGDLNHDGTNIGFFGVAPTTRQTELTDELTTITHTAPGTPDYAVQDLTNIAPFGFATQDEGNTVLSVIANLQVRVNELETKLTAYGLLQDLD